MDILPYASLMKKLKQKRQSLDITQKEVAHRAGVSPAQLSRMENGNAEAKYSTVYSVWETLQKADSSTEETAADICTESIAWVTTEQTGRDARRLMLEKAYSQVPVREPDGEQSVGSLTERILMETEDVDRPIHKLMADPFIEVRPDTSKSAVVELLRDENDALLVGGRGESEYSGIITPADII